MNVFETGSGAPLLLVHGLGGSWRSWDAVLPALAEQRRVIAVDLPGHGTTPGFPGADSFAGLAESLSSFLEARGLDGIDAVGSSLGARLVLELARRGQVGATVALDPGGFWEGWERSFFRTTIGASVRLLRGIRPALPSLSRSKAGRTLLLAQLSARPWALDGEMVARELKGFAETPGLPALVRDLADGPRQEGPAAGASGPIVIGWGRQDRLCLPRQAERAQRAFPSARLHWFDRCGHFPMWDRPEETIRLILGSTGKSDRQAAEESIAGLS